MNARVWPVWLVLIACALGAALFLLTVDLGRGLMCERDAEISYCADGYVEEGR